jgi:hypothetical protein
MMPKYRFPNAISVVLSITLLLSLLPINALADDGGTLLRTSNGDWPWKSRFTVMGGYRVDNLDWNIGGYYTSSWNGGPRETRYINVLSELTWSDLKIYQVTMSNRTVLQERIYFRGSLGYGWIVEGQNQDSDYKGNNRTLEFSRSNNASDKGGVQDFTGGVGYLFKIKPGRIALVPLFGYSLHQQNLRMHAGNQTLSVPPDQMTPLGSIAGLDSSYDADWRGPWIGLDLLIHRPKSFWVFKSMEFDLGIEAHWANYSAEADWNLRNNLQHPRSFEHDADGRGLVLSADWLLTFVKNWELALHLDYQNWTTDPGTDRLYFSDGTTAETRLNEVNWVATAFMLGVTYRF